MCASSMKRRRKAVSREPLRMTVSSIACLVPCLGPCVSPAVSVSLAGLLRSVAGVANTQPWALLGKLWSACVRHTPRC